MFVAVLTVNHMATVGIDEKPLTHKAHGSLSAHSGRKPQRDVDELMRRTESFVNVERLTNCGHSLPCLRGITVPAKLSTQTHCSCWWSIAKGQPSNGSCEGLVLNWVYVYYTARLTHTAPRLVNNIKWYLPLSFVTAGHYVHYVHLCRFSVQNK